MKTSFRKLTTVSLFALSSFAFSSVAQPYTAQAAVGLAIWPLFPLACVGIALEAAAVGTGAASLWYLDNDFPHRASDLGWATLTEFLVGIVFLDEQNQTMSFQQITPEKAQEMKLTEAERISFNKAVEEGKIDAIIQDATSQLDRNSKPEDSKKIVTPLLNALPADAHSAFNKVASHLVSKK